jgi:hypothetical protein
VLATDTLKVLLTEVPAMSVAVTLRERLPTSPLRGVPLKVRVAALKLSQLGNAPKRDRASVIGYLVAALKLSQLGNALPFARVAV